MAPSMLGPNECWRPTCPSTVSTLEAPCTQASPPGASPAPTVKNHFVADCSSPSPSPRSLLPFSAQTGKLPAFHPHNLLRCHGCLAIAQGPDGRPTDPTDLKATLSEVARGREVAPGGGQRPRGGTWRRPGAKRWPLEVARGGGAQSARVFGISVILDPISVSHFYWFLMPVQQKPIK